MITLFGVRSTCESGGVSRLSILIKYLDSSPLPAPTLEHYDYLISLFLMILFYVHFIFVGSMKTTCYFQNDIEHYKTRSCISALCLDGDAVGDLVAPAQV